MKQIVSSKIVFKLAKQFVKNTLKLTISSQIGPDFLGHTEQTVLTS